MKYRRIKQFQFSNNAPSAFRILFYFLIAISIVCPTFYTTGWTVCTFDNPDKIDFAKYWYRENPIPTLLVSTSKHLPQKISGAYSIFIASSSYLLSILLAKKTIDQFKKMSASLSNKTKSLQADLARLVIYLFV